MKRTTPSQNDLDWPAFCYIAGEMSAEEMAKFEERLAVDQASREAVARAVELAEAVAALGPEEIPSPRRGGAASRRPGVVALTVAAICLCVAVGWIVLRGERGAWRSDRSPMAARERQERPSGERASEHVAIHRLPAGDLVALWTQAWSEQDVTSRDTDENSDSNWEAWDSLSVTEADATDAGVVVPDWMLAAVVDDGSGDAPASAGTPHGNDPGRSMEN